MDVKYKCLIFFLLVAISTSAQPFKQAPDLPKKVYQIIEWSRGSLKEKSVRTGTSTFDRNGRLLAYVYENEPEKADSLLLTYNKKGQLIKTTEKIGQSILVSRYSYGKNHQIKEQHFRGKSTKVASYFKNGKKVEEKTFVRGGELGKKYLIKDRTLYNYDARDSLFGEMHYAYSLKSKAKTRQWKVIHEYDPESWQKSKTTFYNEDKQIRLQTQYLQDQKGRPSEIFYHYLMDGSTRRVEYKYKNGHIWQVIDDMNYKKNVKIYTDGRLIRLRSYLGDKLFHVVDYQYVYYDE